MVEVAPVVQLFRNPQHSDTKAPVFTNAYFPLYAFDEHQLACNWAFARVSHAYLTLYGAHGMTLVQKQKGPDANRKWRPSA